MDFPSNKNAAGRACTSQKTLVYFCSGSSVMTESFSVIPETVRFSSLMEQLSNDTTGCEIAFLPAMSNNYLRGEIIAQGILASQKNSNNAANHIRFGARGTERTLLWALCRWNKGKPSTRGAQSVSTPSDCLGQKYGIRFAVRKLKSI